MSVLPSRLAPDRVLPVLSRWGIRTLGQLASLPAVELSERIGQEGLAWRARARGEDAGPLVPTREDDRRYHEAKRSGQGAGWSRHT